MLDIRVIQVDFAIKGSGSFMPPFPYTVYVAILSTAGVTCIAEVT